MKFNKLIPEISVTNLNNSLNFYENILGFNIEYERKKDKFALISLEGSQIMLEEINNHWKTGKLEYPFGRGINFQIEVKNVEQIINNLKKNNYKIMKGLMENWYKVNEILCGNKEFLVMDPDGYLLRFSQNMRNKKIKN